MIRTKEVVVTQIRYEKICPVCESSQTFTSYPDEGYPCNNDCRTLAAKKSKKNCKDCENTGLHYWREDRDCYEGWKMAAKRFCKSCIPINKSAN